jgi:hypothetical protein
MNVWSLDMTGMTDVGRAPIVVEPPSKLVTTVAG